MIGLPVQEYVLVMAAGESTLVGFNPASWVLLLNQVAARLGQAVLQIVLSETLL